jgi:hypothetical protein
LRGSERWDDRASIWRRCASGRRSGPRRNIDDVEYATLVWVDWFNNRRLLEPSGYVPPAEYEPKYYLAHEVGP